MNPIKRRRHRGLAALAAATFAVVGVSQVSASAATKITLTEEDYFNTPGQVSALAPYNKQFEAAHPGCDRNEGIRPVRRFGHKALDASRGPRPAQPLGRRQPVRVNHGHDRPGSAPERFQRLQHQGVFPSHHRRRPVQR